MLRLIIFFLLAVVTVPHADDWGAMATISSTMGVQGGRVCLGENSRGDIGCPSYAPSVSPTGTLNLGAGLTVNTVSLTTGGTTWGYLGNAASYIPNLASNAVSTTNISITTINGVSVSALGGGGGAGVYDSGWFSVTTSKQYTLNHGLGGIPDIVQVFWSNTADGSGNVTLIGNTTYGAANTLINRINNTSIGIFTGPTYLTYLRDPSGTYTGPSTGYHKVIAIRYNGGSGGGGGSGGTGVSAMSSLTDVTLTNPASNNILVYDGSKWVNTFLQDTISTSTMVSGWPDALWCSGTSGQTLLTHGVVVAGTNIHRYHMGDSTSYYVYFNPDGSYNASSGPAYVADCTSKTINQLYTEGKAFNFIGGSGTAALGDRLISGTLAVAANSATGIVSLSTAGTTWGYLGSNASYIPNLASNAISTTNISTTTINGIAVTALGGGGASTSMVPNFPDAIRCNTNSGERVAYLTNAPYTDGRYYYVEGTSSGNSYVLAFNSDGTYYTHYTYTSVGACTGTISFLYAAGRAYNLVGGSGSTAPDYQVFTASGTWTKPANLPAYAMVEVEMWGGGGGGSSGNPNTGPGGGGGSYNKFVISASSLPATVAVTVGSGGALLGTGGTSSFGSYASAYGGSSAASASGGLPGGGGGGVFSAAADNARGNGGEPGLGGTGASANGLGGTGFWGGGGGGGGYASGVNNGGNSVFGGAGGGSCQNSTTFGAGGISQYGGNGGAGGQPGVVPGGGGGCKGVGARGEVRVKTL